MKDYVDARREFWERVFVAVKARNGQNTATEADIAVESWDRRYKLGPNGTVVPRDTEAGTYKASEAGAG